MSNVYHISTGNQKRQQTGLCGAVATHRFRANSDYTLNQPVVDQIKKNEVRVCSDCLTRLGDIRKSYVETNAKGDAPAPTSPTKTNAPDEPVANPEIPEHLLPGR